MADAEVVALFASHHVVLAPYRSASQSGIVPLARSAGRLVVATKVGGLAEGFSEGIDGELAAPDDPSAFADAIQRAIDRVGDEPSCSDDNVVGTLWPRRSWSSVDESYRRRRPRRSPRPHRKSPRELALLFGWLGDLSGSRVTRCGGRRRLLGRPGSKAEEPQASRSTSIPSAPIVAGASHSKPLLVRGDALRLPFADGSFDAVMSISSIEHFDSGSSAIAEMGRVLRPGGSFVLSADSLAGSDRWPRLAEAHEHRYGVVHPFEHRELEEHLGTNGFGAGPFRLHVQTTLGQPSVSGAFATSARVERSRPVVTSRRALRSQSRF